MGNSYSIEQDPCLWSEDLSLLVFCVMLQNLELVNIKRKAIFNIGKLQELKKSMLYKVNALPPESGREISTNFDSSGF